MPKIRCESCGELKEVDSREMSSWAGGNTQFFCEDCKERLGIPDEDD